MLEALQAIPQRQIDIPRGVKLALTVTYVVGVLSFFMALGENATQGHGREEVTVALVANIAVALAVWVAAHLVRQGRKAGAYLIVVAWVVPMVIGLRSGSGAAGSFLLLAAMITIGFNWKSMW